jgi:hypothetical protein
MTGHLDLAMKLAVRNFDIVFSELENMLTPPQDNIITCCQGVVFAAFYAA